jgi:hypothetical protein
MLLFTWWKYFLIDSRGRFVMQIKQSLSQLQQIQSVFFSLMRVLLAVAKRILIGWMKLTKISYVPFVTEICPLLGESCPLCP